METYSLFLWKKKGKKPHDSHWIKNILFFLQEFHYYWLDARFTFCHKKQRQFFLVEKERLLQFHVEQAWFSRAGATGKYFSWVKIMVEALIFTAGESWREKDSCTKIVNDD